jgi:succinate-semialdehyde dehydrogenase/glutarate-semialdehyde dehydrogenase
MTGIAMTEPRSRSNLAEALALIDESPMVADGLAVHDPASGALVATVRSWSPQEAAEAIAAADAARPAWAALTAKARAVILDRWFDLILAHRAALATLITAESGKPLDEAHGEVDFGASFVEWFAEEGRRAYGEVIPTFAADRRIVTLRQPVGTCAAITPWNFPLAMITRKVAPALAAGCSIVLKPAEATPLSALALAALARQAGLPADLFRVVPTTGPAAMGRMFCTHPLVRKLSFTGSTRVGKTLMEQAASQVMRLSLELGGNAPLIVMDDADLDRAVQGVMDAKFRNAGQTCVCANRILVQAPVHDDFVARLAVKVRALTVGAGADAGARIGPLINGDAARRVAGLVEQTVAAGARVAAAAPLPGAAGPGFVAPVLLTGVRQDMAIARGEIFGPVAPVIAFADEAEAIRLANDTPYGLAAYLFTRDLGRAWRMMEALEYGMVAVNEGRLSTEVAPFGGIKQSGIGREGSAHGLMEYMEIKYGLLGL